MKTKTTLMLATAGLFALSACTDTSGGYQSSAPTQSRAQSGAVTGAIIGGLLGGTRKGDDKLAKAAVGAAIGAGVGGLIGSQLDKQAAELQRDIGSNGVSIVNNGNQLVVTMPQDVLFATDSATLRPDLQGDIYTLAGSLNRYPNTRVQVVGHTDNTGAADYNQRLSQQRANSVASVLISAGVPSSRVQAYGRGEDQPIASNYTPEGRAQNRRVEFIIVPTN
ncbi:OmpA family protein [Phaeovulum sp. W22_SRMD_FR3]|uniref:OmpA family protein n=1 Tax=Phaeovulum sp. W22_SRMD_FR3 TaxID=3240274 RepID=UPI003F9EB4C5